MAFDINVTAVKSVLAGMANLIDFADQAGLPQGQRSLAWVFDHGNRKRP